MDPGEPLLSVNVASSLMPLAGRRARTAHRWAMGIGLGLAAVSAAVGLLPFALAVAAITAPVVYVVYLYDVNEWEDQPIPVLLATVVLSGALAVGFTYLWFYVIMNEQVVSPTIGFGFDVDWDTLLVVGLLVPAGVLVLSQLGPLWLVARRGFDDLIDGLTFGVAAGAAFAMVETFVLANGLIFGGPGRIDSPDAAIWVSLILIVGLVKPLVYASAVGIAVASFSGLGERCDGFSGQYARGVLEAFASLVAFRVGLYLTGQLGGTLAMVLGLLWGLLVAAWLLLRVRVVLQAALLEAALRAEASGTAPATAAHGVAFCGECEMPLVDSASFCVVCGAAVRAAPKPVRVANAAGGSGPSDVSWSANPAASTRTSTALLLVVGVLVIALSGALIAAVNSGTRTTPSKHIGLDTGGQRRALQLLPAGLGPPSPTGSDTVEGPNGIRIKVPAGWHVNNSGDTWVQLYPDEGPSFATVESFAPERAFPAIDWLQGFAIDQRLRANHQQIDGTVNQLAEADLSQGVKEEVTFPFTSLEVHSDGTTNPFEGWVAVLITDGGNVVITYYGNAQGNWKTFEAAYQEINDSVLASLPE
ncbi:MAG TPA: hypothetical protein VIH82_14060 [Acidimicrobiia bacterium]